MSLSLIKYVMAQNMIRKKCEEMSAGQVTELMLLINNDLSQRKKKKK